MKRVLNFFFHSKVVINATWLIVGKIVQMVLNLIVTLLTARYLGPSNYGVINYVAAYIAFFTSFCTLGINSIQVKELLEHQEDQGTVMGTTLGLRLISSFLSAVAIISIVCVVDRDEPTTIMIAILSSIGVIFHVFECFNFFFQSKLQSKITAIIAVFAYFITSAYRIVLLVSKAGVALFALANSIDYLAVAILLVIAYKKHGGDKLNFSFGYGKELLKKSCPFILSGLMIAIYGKTDKIMLKQIMGDAEIGYYSTATAICNIWCFVLNAIICSMTPPIIEAFKKDKQEFERRNKQLYAIVFYLALFVSLLITFAAPLIVRILYGEAFMPTVVPLRVITWYTAFSYLGVARDIWVVCHQYQKYITYIYIIAAFCNVILNLIFIPLWGSGGAALASLLTQITTIIFPVFLKDMRENVRLMFEALCFKGVLSKNK